MLFCSCFFVCLFPCIVSFQPNTSPGICACLGSQVASNPRKCVCVCVCVCVCGGGGFGGSEDG